MQSGFGAFSCQGDARPLRPALTGFTSFLASGGIAMAFASAFKLQRCAHAKKEKYFNWRMEKREGERERRERLSPRGINFLCLCAHACEPQFCVGQHKHKHKAPAC